LCTVCTFRTYSRERTQVLDELERIEATMSLPEVVTFRKVSMLQLAFEDDQIQQAFGGQEGYAQRLEHMLLPEEAPQHQPPKKTWLGDAFGELADNFRATTATTPTPTLGERFSCVRVQASLGASPPRPSRSSSIDSATLSVHLRIGAQFEHAYKTYVRVSIPRVSNDEDDTSPTARTQWTPTATCDPNWDETLTLPFDPTLDKLLHIVVFKYKAKALLSLGGESAEPLGELIISLTAVNHFPEQFGDGLWPYNLVKANVRLGAMDASGAVLPTVGALFMTVRRHVPDSMLEQRANLRDSYVNYESSVSTPGGGDGLAEPSAPGRESYAALRQPRVTFEDERAKSDLSASSEASQLSYEKPQFGATVHAPL
jgi:hypothetical protein